jgi:hypothetical protein
MEQKTGTSLSLQAIFTNFLEGMMASRCLKNNLLIRARKMSYLLCPSEFGKYAYRCPSLSRANGPIRSEYLMYRVWMVVTHIWENALCYVRRVKFDTPLTQTY